MAEKKPATKKAAKKVSRKIADTTSTFAVLEAGGKQYRVKEGDMITIEKISDTSVVGDKIVFDKVLLVENAGATTIGAPYIAGAAVHAELTENGRGKKIRVVKYKAKSRYLKQNGHRQPFAKVTITAIK